jgi:hypothetical protein
MSLFSNTVEIRQLPGTCLLLLSMGRSTVLLLPRERAAITIDYGPSIGPAQRYADSIRQPRPRSSFLSELSLTYDHFPLVSAHSAGECRLLSGAVHLITLKSNLTGEVDGADQNMIASDIIKEY